MDQLELCRLIATVAHAAKGQYRADEVTPYIEHPRRVAELTECLGQYLPSRELGPARCSAWLHDVIEDTKVTPAHLRVWGVEKRTIEIVELLTKENAAHEAETAEYYAAIARDDTALLVKCSDRCANIEDALEEVKRGNVKRWRTYVERTYSDVLPLYASLPELRAELETRLKAIEDAMLEARGSETTFSRRERDDEGNVIFPAISLREAERCKHGLERQGFTARIVHDPLRVLAKKEVDGE